MTFTADHFVVLLLVLDALLAAGRGPEAAAEELKLCVSFYTQPTKTRLKALVAENRRNHPDSVTKMLEEWKVAETHRSPRHAVRFFSKVLL